MKFLLLAFFPFLLSAQNKSAALHSETESKEIIDTLYTKLMSGADFTKLANLYSEDPGTKGKGGVYANAKEGTFTPEFEEVVLKLKVLEISQPFKSPYGYHIAQVMSRQGNVFTVRHILIRF